MEKSDLLIYDSQTLAFKQQLAMPKQMQEGWGLTYDPEAGLLYASTGSSTLYVLNRTTMEVIRPIDVRVAGQPLERLNELQWIRGEIWANMWMRDDIAVINPHTGDVRCFIDLTQLRTSQDSKTFGLWWVGLGDKVLNGIAWDDANERLFATGKLWPKLFEIEVKWES